MITRFIFAAAFLFALNANAQPAYRCEQTTASASSTYEAQLQQWIASHPQNAAQSTVTIPVVVHVVYKLPVQNISALQVMSQIEVLNEDYGRTNADTVKTPAGFLPVAANTGIQFCLAQTDPNGNPTTGIDYVLTTMNSFTLNNNEKHASTGGADAWDVSRYFNIWVCKISTGALGGAEFPTTTLSNTFGVTISYTAFGSNYTSYGTFPGLYAPYDHGRTATHEIGHCLNLAHPSTGSSSCTTDNDNVADTPVPFGSTTNPCPAYPLLDNCNPTAPGVQFMNFMAQPTEDTCMNLFTAGQAARMNAVLSTAPYNTLATSTGCMIMGLNVFSDENLFSVTPNPSAGKFTLQFSNVSPCRISVYNQTGSLVLDEVNASHTNTMEIDLSAKADGIYFIRVLFAGAVVNRKISVSR